MHISRKFALVGALALLAGCTTVKSWFGAGPTNPPAALVEFKSTMAVRTVWSTNVGKADEFNFSPALAAGNVFSAGADGTISKNDAATGRTLWRIDTRAKLTAGVGSDGLTTAVAAEKGVVLAYDEQGVLRWKAQVSSEVLSAPAVGAGLVVVRSVDNRVVAFDAITGARRWIAQRSVPTLTLRSAPGIVIGDSTVYVALPGGKLLALATSNGGPRWEVAVGDPRGATELERLTDISGIPALSGRDICAVTYQGRVACLETGNGSVRWAKDLSSDVSVAIDERFVFAADERGAINAYTRETGQSVWRNDKLAYRRLSTPVSFGRAVAVGDGQGYVHFLSREDGAFLTRISTDGSPIVAAPLVAGANLIFQTQSGTVTALASE